MITDSALNEPALEGPGQLHTAWRLAMLDVLSPELLTQVASVDFADNWLRDADTQRANFQVMRAVRVLLSSQRHVSVRLPHDLRSCPAASL